MALPAFRYHPDPIGTGSIVASEAACISCGEHRGYIYAGAVYATRDLSRKLCPWCVADGSAAARFDASFVDHLGVGGYGAWCAVDQAVVAVICNRTPGFLGWQQEQWWTHCGDAAAFLGRAGYEELQARWPDAIPALALAEDIPTDSLYFRGLKADGSPTAYVFRCLHCSALGGYTDCD